jgi:hypothetical protein
MSELVYAIGGLAIAAGGLAAGWYLISLFRIRQAKPVVRRRAWTGFGCSLGLVLVGALLVLSADDRAASWLGAITATALLIWQLGAMLQSRAQRRSAS